MDMLIDCAIHRISHLLSSEKLILQGMNPGKAQFLGLNREALLRMGLGSPRRGWHYSPKDALDRAEADLQWLGRRGCHLLPLWGGSYPALLRQLYNPPFLLFCRSSPAVNLSEPVRHGSLFRQPAVAMVGTRRPSAAGERWARHLSREMAVRGVVIVSGLARGIDSMAHLGAVAASLQSVAVLGHGPDCLYPSSNIRLATEMLASGGCLISEYPPGTPPRAFRFPERNRIISGLSAGVLVLEAPEKSGALITAEFALEQGRDVLVWKPLLDSRRNAGGRALADSGAPAVSTADQLLAELSTDLLFPGGKCRS
jgi:DNA processing protein